MNRFWFLFKSTAVRLSALYILLFAICAATLVFYVTAMSERLLTNQIREAVQQEVDQVKRAYDAGGMNLLLRTMERRARQPGANLSLITLAAGVAVHGNAATVVDDSDRVIEVDGDVDLIAIPGQGFID